MMCGALLMTSCAKSLPSGNNDFCIRAIPFRPAKGETARLSDQLQTFGLYHNRTGAELCGWRP